MNLALIINCWGDWDLLRIILPIMRPLVNGVIVIGSTKSNFGEYCPIPDDFDNSELFVREPRHHVPLHSETDKRNYGLDVARKKGYSHFITADADEVYDPIQFLKVKAKFENQDLDGLVCPCTVYFTSPKLTIGRDITLVPFIHKLSKNIKHEFNRHYPFAWSGKQIRIDPSRSLNINFGIKYTDEIEMHHFSWYRADYEKKIRNSTARGNLERSSIREDIKNAAPGYHCKFYNRVLTQCEDKFNISEHFGSLKA